MPVRQISPRTILSAPRDFQWRGRIASGLPILLETDGSVCEPVMQWFGWSHWTNRVSIRSLQKEAYVIRDWLAFLDSIQCAWTDATDRTLSDWRECMLAEDDGRRPISEQRVRDKCHTVFTFYDNIHEALVSPLRFTGEAGPITRRIIRSRGRPWHGVLSVQWALNKGGATPAVRRKTPDDQLAQQVLIALRNGAKGSKERPNEAREINDRNWLIGRAMQEVGLRREEARDLTIRMISQGLVDEGIKVPLGISGPDLDMISSKEEENEIINALDRLQYRAHRENIWIGIVGKGRKPREAPFPIELIKDILIFGVWGVRRSQFDRWREESPSFRAPEEMFLSSRGSCLAVGTVGNILKDAFAACGSNLSAHRLRAYFATKMASRLWNDAFTLNGFRWDQALENVVLDRVAQALGHSKVDTTIRHYLSLAQMEFFSEPTKPKLKNLRKGAASLKALGDSELALGNQILARLSVQGDGTDFFSALERLLVHPGLSPPPEVSRIEDGSDGVLRLIPRPD